MRKAYIKLKTLSPQSAYDKRQYPEASISRCQNDVPVLLFAIYSLLMLMVPPQMNIYVLDAWYDYRYKK